MTEAGASFDDALAEAQRLGYAERDPTADVEGFDAAAKARSSRRSRSARGSSPATCTARASRGITAADIAVAARLGYVVKLLAIAEGPTTSVAVRVHPAMVPGDHPLASVRDAFNAVFIEGDAVGQLMFYGRGAGGRPTASAVLGDLIDAAHATCVGGRAGRDASARSPRAIRPIDETRGAVLPEPRGRRPARRARRDRRRVRRPRRVDPADAAGGHRRARPRLIFITHRAREARLPGDGPSGVRELGACTASARSCGWWARNRERRRPRATVARADRGVPGAPAGHRRHAGHHLARGQHAAGPSDAAVGTSTGCRGAGSSSRARIPPGRSRTAG